MTLDSIKLKDLNYGEEDIILNMIYSDEELQDTFSGGHNTMSRILNADYSGLIKLGRINVGFIMLVFNGRTGKHEIDMGILKKYRGNGYGTQALGLLKKRILKSNISIDIQIKQANEAAIKSVLKNGFVLYNQDKECYYFKIVENKKNLN